MSMDVKLGGKTFTIEQSWGAYKAYDKACDELEDAAREATEKDDKAAVKTAGESLETLQLDQLRKCLKKVGAAEFDGDLDALGYNEVFGLLMRLRNPMMELSTRLPFEERPTNV